MLDSRKKSLMYVSGDDFYFFTYSIFIALDVLGCVSGTFFKDYRKLPFLIEFVRDENLLYILEQTTKIAGPSSATPGVRQLNPIDRDYLFRSYSNGIARRSEILKLLFTLEKSGYVELSKGDRGIQAMVDVSLSKERLPSTFLDKKMFAKEYANMRRLKSHVKRLSVLTHDSLLERLYENQGVKTWAL
ncbi:hypothetical protein [Herbaspirillum sp. 1130]|uniref:hypothetical protein n=1 Tax=Herbaspirillum sp. 1130 TaxID=2806562 RepID=UPI001AE10920|nr:hypothetical protein [Herbaspirillum sp. 1130]MBP1317120.1 hypothetical protein [Herbaspirillum sp. 1130]